MFTRCKCHAHVFLLKGPKDLQAVSTKGKDVSVVLTLTANPDSFLVLDGDYTITVKTTGGNGDGGVVVDVQGRLCNALHVCVTGVVWGVVEC